jgi:hypothetical protein
VVGLLGETPPTTGRVTLDESLRPLLVLTFHGEVGPHELDRHLEALAATLRRGTEPCVLVYDAMNATMPSAAQRKRQAEWIREHTAMLRQKTIASVFAIGSSLLRGAITAIFWVQPAPTRTHVVSSRAEAIDWARQQLRASGAR